MTVEDDAVEMPEGYRRWYCAVCTASCNFEAMEWCARTPDCGFYLDKPESLGGAFEFIIPTGSRPDGL